MPARRAPGASGLARRAGRAGRAEAAHRAGGERASGPPDAEGSEMLLLVGAQHAAAVPAPLFGEPRAQGPLRDVHSPPAAVGRELPRASCRHRPPRAAAVRRPERAERLHVLLPVLQQPAGARARPAVSGRPCARAVHS